MSNASSFSKKDLAGVTFIGAAVFLFLSLISYKSGIDSIYQTIVSASPTSNLTGNIGASIAEVFLETFGVVSFLIPVAFVVLGLFYIFLDDKQRFPFLKVTASAFFVIFLTAIFNISLIDFSYGGAKFQAGGAFGVVISDVLNPYLASTGTFLATLAACFMLLCYITNISANTVFTVAAMLIYKLVKILTPVFKYAYKKTPVVLKLIGSFFVFTYEQIRSLKTINSDQELISESEDEASITIPIVEKTNGATKIALKQKKAAPALLDDDEDEDDLNISVKPVAKFNKKLPSVSILNKAPKRTVARDSSELKETAAALQARLHDFGVEGEVVEVSPGPVITMYEFKPGSGVKINKVANLSDDLALALGCGSVRVIAPIPGKSVIGIEVPNKTRETVYMRELVESDFFKNADKKIPIAMGKNIEGDTYVTDLSKMPHLLVAGSTGSGKSVFINTLISSILYKFTAEEVRLIMVDPKMLELSIYDGIPHLLLPVVTEPSKASQALKWAVKEMIRRYTVLSESNCRNIANYNKKADEKLPYIVIIIDELADLMMVCSKEVEASITRLAQMARAAGIHLVLATQRPSVDVITGLIKANFPARVAFKVSSRIDARTIMDTQGAEKLLGNGDMLFLAPGTSIVERLHGAFISDEEVKDLVDFVKQQGEPDYQNEILKTEEEENAESGENIADTDPLYDEAVNIVVESKKASISYLQRRLKIGYNRSANLIEAMEREGVVSGQLSSGSREVLIENQ